MIKFQIEDEMHAEPQGDYDTFEEAVTELSRRAKIDWGQRTQQMSLHELENVRERLSNF